MAERDRLQPRDSVAAVGVASTNRDLVADQFAAAFGENRRSIGQARTVLLAVVGGEPSHATVVWALLGLALSEKQIPQVDENTEESKSLLEPLESVGRRPRQARYQAALRPDNN